MVQSTEKWGKAAARERYGQPKSGGVTPAKSEQAPQCPEDKHGAGYDNDASGWVRGVGKPYPHFDTHKSGSK